MRLETKPHHRVSCWLILDPWILSEWISSQYQDLPSIISQSALRQTKKNPFNWTRRKLCFRFCLTFSKKTCCTSNKIGFSLQETGDSNSITDATWFWLRRHSFKRRFTITKRSLDSTCDRLWQTTSQEVVRSAEERGEEADVMQLDGLACGQQICCHCHI